MSVSSIAVRACQLLLASTVLLIAACASGPERSADASSDNTEGQSALASSEAAAAEAVGQDPFPGFKRLYIQGGGMLYVRDQSAFESYDNWLLDEAGVEFDKAQVPLNAKEQAQLRMLMFRARVQQTKYYGAVVKKPGACTLTQQLHLKRLRLYKSAAEGPVVNFISSFGEAVIVAEIKDSLTGELVFAYVEPVRLGRGVTKSASPDMDRLAAAMTEAMERAHRALVEQLPVDSERIDDRANLGCNGQIGRNVLEIRKVLQQG
ncbi:MAG: hypothetical protein WBN40_04075 [Pseudomonadales bacterium]